MFFLVHLFIKCFSISLLVSNEIDQNFFICRRCPRERSNYSHNSTKIPGLSIQFERIKTTICKETSVRETSPTIQIQISIIKTLILFFAVCFTNFADSSRRHSLVNTQISPVPHASKLPPRHLARVTQARAIKLLHVDATRGLAFGRPVETKPAFVLIIDAMKLLQGSWAAGSVLNSVIVAAGEIGGFEKTHVRRGGNRCGFRSSTAGFRASDRSDEGTTVGVDGGSVERKLNVINIQN